MWLQRAFPLDRELLLLHQQPLVHVLSFLREPHGRHEYRNLAESVFVAAKALDFEHSEHRLASSGKKAAKRVKCPVLDCPSRLKSAEKLIVHMRMHPHLAALSAAEWDELMTTVGLEDVAAAAPSGAPLPLVPPPSASHVAPAHDAAKRHRKT